MGIPPGVYGFLNGKKATTHWRYAEQFKATFPEIEYVEDVFYLYDGPICLTNALAQSGK
jgi:transcriptional regulator GlxA family with amidase domain